MFMKIKLNMKSISCLLLSLKSYAIVFFMKKRSILHFGDGHSRTIEWLKLIIAGVIISAFIFFVIILSFDFSDMMKTNFPKVSVNKQSFSKIQKLTLSYMDSKNNLASVFLKEAEELNGENKIIVNNIDTKIVFNTNEWISVQSDDAVIDKDTSEIYLKNNVLITDYKGDKLNGKNIKINIKENAVFSDDMVNIDSFLGKITSTNGFYVKKDSKYLFKGGVKMLLNEQLFSKNNEIPFRKINTNFSNKSTANKKLKQHENKVIKSINHKSDFVKKLKR